MSLVKFIVTFMSSSLFVFGAQATTQNDDLAKLHLVYLVGIDAANMGKAKGCTAKVKSFGTQMASDYANADQKLKIFASQNNFALGTPELSSWETQNVEKFQADISRVREIDGCTFDNLYLQVVRDGHSFAIKIAEKIVASQDNSKTKAFMSSALGGLKNNHSKAINLLSR